MSPVSPVRGVLLGAAQAVVWASVPVLLLQGRRVRRKTPRLPEARGPAGIARADAGGAPGGPLRLLVLGDSTAAGVGVATHAEALAGRLGAELAARTGRDVRWWAKGRTGHTARDVHRSLAPGAADHDRPDVAVVLVGVNDVLRLTAVRTFARGIGAILTALRERYGDDVAVILGAVPSMGDFPALPWPLRPLLGLRARALDLAAVRAAAAMPGVVHVPMPPPPVGEGAAFYADDRFHPGARGYALWAAELSRHCPPAPG